MSTFRKEGEGFGMDGLDHVFPVSGPNLGILKLQSVLSCARPRDKAIRSDWALQCQQNPYNHEN